MSNVDGHKLEGRKAVVTGAASGIGLASARRFAAEGATVALWDRDPDTLAEAVKTVAADGGEAHGIEVDVADVASIATAAAETLRLLGRVTVLMNNAGVFDGFASIMDTDDDLWNRVIGIN